MLALSLIFLLPSEIGSFRGRVMVWTSLITGMVAGLGAIQCVTYLKRRKLEVPFISVAAVVVGGATLIGSGLMIARVIYLKMTCHNFPIGC